MHITKHCEVIIIAKLTLGSLFDGIGGFPLCAERSDIEPVWASEIDPCCIAVSSLHFPHIQHLGNISQIDGSKIPPVDIITFGSPCQDVSIAGKRKGIKHTENGDEETTRSGLFFDAVRIIGEMREATNGEYPKYIVWENVAGAFTSCGGEDFRTVLEEIARIADRGVSIPLPKKGKWMYAGEVVGEDYSIAWRTLDAQYWGVPQRRKRIYLVASFRDDSAARILFKPESLSGYFAQSPEEREEPSDLAVHSIRATGTAGGTTYDVRFSSEGTKNSRGHCYETSISRALDTGGQNSDSNQGGIAVVYDARGNGDGKTVPTITGDHNNRITDFTGCVVYSLQGSMIGRSDNNGPQGSGIGENKSFTLNTVDRHGVAYAIGNGQADNTGLHEKTGALNCMHDAQAVIYENISYGGYREGCGTLKASGGDYGGGSENIVVSEPPHWTVRRLTPLECERLQGFPDNWTALPKKTEMSDDEYDFWKSCYIQDKQLRNKRVCGNLTKKKILKWYNGLDIDAARYRMLGNSLAIPCALRVISGIAEYLYSDKEECEH